MSRLSMLLVTMLTITATQSAVWADEPADATKKKLVGVWAGRVDNGATGHTITITADLISGTKDGTRDLGKGSYKIDLSTEPWQLDATEVKEGKPGTVWLGNFKLEGDSLTWCVSNKTRPTKFETGNGQFMLVLKRQAGGQTSAPTSANR